MTTYNTGNPVPSADARDRFDNSQTFDELLNGALPSYLNRMGQLLKSWQGFQSDFTQFLLDSGYQFIGDYDTDGPLTITRPNQVFSKSGDYWRPGPSLTLPYTTLNNWAIDQPKFVSVGDAAVRSDLANPSLGASLVALLNGGTLADVNKIVTPEMKGATPGADSTSALQAALDDPRPVLVISQAYMVNAETRLYPPSGKKIIFIGAGSLSALPATSAFYSIFDIENKENISIVDPVLVGDRDTHLGVGGEQGFGIRCLSSHNIELLGGDLSKFWGDGVYFGATDTSTHVNCSGIRVIGLNSHHNRRQGMSLTGVVGGYFENCLFNDTNGTNPQSGLDIEPNAGFKCTSLTFVNCSAERNAGAGFELLDAANASNVYDVNFINCPSRSNGTNGLRLVSARKVTHTGEVSANGSHGVYAIQGSNDLSLPAPDIHNNGGDGVQILTNTTGTMVGPGKIYANGGFGVQANYRTSLRQVEVYGNALGGWYFGATSVRSKALDCYVYDNGGTGGESAASSSQTLVSGGEYTSNSLTTNLAAHNLAIYGNDCQVVSNVKVRVGVNANKPAYGLRTTGNSGLVCKGNDFRGAGATGDIFQQTLTNADVSDNFPYLRAGTTAQRPASYLVIGQQYYDQTLGKPVWWFGSNWRDAAGTVV